VRWYETGIWEANTNSSLDLPRTFKRTSHQSRVSDSSKVYLRTRKTEVLILTTVRHNDNNNLILMHLRKLPWLNH